MLKTKHWSATAKTDGAARESTTTLTSMLEDTIIAAFAPLMMTADENVSNVSALAFVFHAPLERTTANARCDGQCEKTE